MTHDTMRSFIAFDISDETRKALGEAQRAMGRQSPVRWVKPAGIHLTMKFLGEISDNLVGEVLAVMKEAVRDVEPFEFEVSGLGCFPSTRRPRVIWAGVESDEETLSGIAAALDKGLSVIGIAPEERAFKPHMTLGRVRGSLGEGGIEEMFDRVRVGAFGVNVARELVLFMSELHPSGARYTRLGAVGL